MLDFIASNLAIVIISAIVLWSLAALGVIIIVSMNKYEDENVTESRDDSYIEAVTPETMSN